MGTQWIHVDLYGKTASKLKKNRKDTGAEERVFNASEIAGEQMRVEENSQHVANPLPPKIIFGIDPREVVCEALESFANEPKVIVNTKNGPRERSVRSDTPIVLAGTCSWPDSVEVVGNDEERALLYRRWIAESLKFLRKTYGKDLKSVVLHVDEAHPHLHFTVACKRAVEVVKYHPGVSADSRTNAKKALSAFQDSYYREVAVKCALGRFGPKRMRYKGGVYKQVKAEREAFARELTRLEQRMQLLEEMEKMATSSLTVALEQAGEIIASALNRAKVEGEKLLAAAREQADKLIQASKDVMDDLRKKDAEIERTLGDLKQYADPKTVKNAERLVGKSSITRKQIKEDIERRRKEKVEALPKQDPEKPSKPV